MKKIVFLLNSFLILILASQIFNCSSSIMSDNPQSWQHFTMYVDSHDKNPNNGQMVNKLRDDLFLDESVLWSKFQLVVKIDEPDTSQNFIVVGDYDCKDVETDPLAYRYSWSTVSKDVQLWLINRNGKNKIEKSEVDTKSIDKNLYKDPRSWTYFKINVRTVDDSVFYWFQHDLGIDPILDSYTLIVNVSDDKTENEYVVIGTTDILKPGFKGDENQSYGFNWSLLSPKVQHGLLKWTGKNKEKLKI